MFTFKPYIKSKEGNHGASYACRGVRTGVGAVLNATEESLLMPVSGIETVILSSPACYLITTLTELSRS